MRFRDMRRLVETDLRDLQKLLNRNPKTARAELVGCPVYSFTDKPPSFFPGLGGSGFDLLYLDPRAIDLFGTGSKAKYISMLDQDECQGLD
jgi:hypothetical protein